MVYDPKAPVAYLVRRWRLHVCDWCRRPKREHAAGHCLFDSTTFTPISFEKLHHIALKHSTQKELYAFIRDELQQEEDAVETVMSAQLTEFQKKNDVMAAFRDINEANEVAEVRSAKTKVHHRVVKLEYNDGSLDLTAKTISEQRLGVDYLVVVVKVSHE